MSEHADNDFFPMLQGPPITWKIARLIYRMYGRGQTLERIAERGGFGWAEVRSMVDFHEDVNGHGSVGRMYHIPTLEAETSNCESDK